MGSGRSARSKSPLRRPRSQTAGIFGTAEMLGNPAPCYRNLSIQIDRGNRMTAYDGQGQKRWQLSLQELCSMRGNPPRFVRSLACADGELLLFSVGLRLAAIDVPKSGVEPSVRWIMDMDDLNVTSPDRPMPLPAIVMPWHFYLDQVAQEDRLRVFGPLSSHCVCFCRFSNLVAADPRNGKTLWIRRDLPRGCVVFGDDRYVFVLSPQRDEAMVLHASNGELAGTRKMPPIADKRGSESCLAILGRKILLWQPQGDRRCLAYSTRWRAARIGRSEHSQAARTGQNDW